MYLPNFFDYLSKEKNFSNSRASSVAPMYSFASPFPLSTINLIGRFTKDVGIFVEIDPRVSDMADHS